MLLAAQRAAAKSVGRSQRSSALNFVSISTASVGRSSRRSAHAALSRRFAGETPAAAHGQGAVRSFADSATPPKPKPRAKPRARGGEAVGQRTLGQFAADNWAYGVFGTILAGAGLFVFQCMQEGRNPMKELRNTIDEFFENTEALSDPDPEQFGIQFLQMGGNPIQHVPMYAQDGEKVSPIVTIVFAMEGTLVKRTHDRKYGYRHVRRPAVGALLKSLQDKEVSTFFWTKQSSQQSMGDPNSIAYQLLKDTKMLRAAGELSVCAFSRDHMYVVNGKPQIRLSPLPRYTPNMLLVDSDQWNYDAQPNNTLLIKEYTDTKNDDGSALMDVMAFMKLFRHLWKKREVKTVEDTMLWLKNKYPQIRSDPMCMGECIREAAGSLMEEESRLQTESMGRVLKDIHRSSKAISSARAVTPHSSTYQRVHEDSALGDRIAKAKQRQAAAMAKHQADMAAEAQGPMAS